MTKSRRKFDAAFKAKAGLEAIAEKSTVPELARRRDGHPSGASAAGERERERPRQAATLCAKIGRLAVERDFLAMRPGPDIHLQAYALR